VTKPTATQRLSTQGGVSVSGDVLVPLLHRVRLNGSEWRIVVAVLISSRPVSARELALGLRLDYGFVKRIVRGLVAWRILSATPEGLSVQPDATRWAAAPRGRAPALITDAHPFPAACRVPNPAKRLSVVQRPKSLFESQRSMTSRS